MGFFDKLKKNLGVGGVKLQLQIPPNVVAKDSQIVGKVVVTSESPLTVSKVTVKLVETHTRREADANGVHKTEINNVGQVDLTEIFQIGPGQQKIIDFTLPFLLRATANSQLLEMGGAAASVGKNLNALFGDQRITYRLEASADVEGVALGPSNTVNVNLV
jgi:hypothetical protein